MEAFVRHKMNLLALAALAQGQADPKLIGEDIKHAMLTDKEGKDE